MKPPRVLLADDHAVVIEGLRRILEPECEIVGEVANGCALLAAAERLRPDVIVVDISMPLLNGIEAVRRIRKSNSEVKIVFLTMHPDVTYAAEALRSGGSAYVLKSSAGTEILEAIGESLRGRIYVTPSVNKALVRAQLETSRRGDMRAELTSRQREVLQLIAEGRSSKQIAGILHVSPRTVEFHKYRIMRTHALRTTAELVQYAIRRGIAPL